MARHDPTPFVLCVPVAFALLETPLEYTVAAHLHHRLACARLRGLGRQRIVGRAEADLAIAYLTGDLRLQHDDEDIDIYPALRRRARPADDLGDVLARLNADHRRAGAIADNIVASLASSHDGDPVHMNAAFAEMMKGFAASELRHLALENGIVLPIARIRLSGLDLLEISNSMKARRGVLGA